jgi:cholesterol transport system auxiliary component
MTVAWRMRRHALAIISLAVMSLSGCSLLTPPSEPPRLGMLNELPSTPAAPAAQATARATATIRVSMPLSQRAYDTTQMAYMLREHEIAYYRDHEWGATPSEMLLPLLVSTLQRSQAFAAVLTAPSVGASTYVLHTRVDELVQDYTGPAAMARVSLHVQWIHQVRQRAVSRELAVSVPMAGRTPEAGIDAANKATAKALQEVARFVLDSIAADSSAAVE